MKPSILLLLLLSTLSSTFAQGTAFTYQGRLNVAGAPANGLFYFQFSIFDDPDLGKEQANPVQLDKVPVTNGLFTVEINPGVGVFTGDPRWLEIGVRTDEEEDYNLLSPRQPITATPYAIHAGSANSATSAQGVTGPVAASQITGTVPLARLPANVLINGASNVGIGTSNPGAMLDVAGPVRANCVMLNPVDNAGEGGELLLKGSTGQPDWVMDVLFNTLRFTAVGVGNTTALSLDSGGSATVANELRWGLNSRLSPDQGGSIELGPFSGTGQTPVIDFHYGTGTAQDYNVRVINSADQQLDIARIGSGTPIARFNTNGLTVNGNTVINSAGAWVGSPTGGAVFTALAGAVGVNASVPALSVNLEANKTYQLEAKLLGTCGCIPLPGASTSGSGNCSIVYTGSATTDYGLQINGTFLSDTTIDSAPSYNVTVTYGPGVSLMLTVGGYLHTVTAGSLGIICTGGGTFGGSVREGSYIIARPLN